MGLGGEDAIDRLAGIAAGSALDALRRRKPITRDNAQASFLTLFAPAESGGVPALERAAVAGFVAALHDDGPGRLLYAEALAAAGAPQALLAALDAEARRGAGTGPYGQFPAGPLSVEDAAGPVYAVGAEARAALGGRLAAALEHAHMLVLHPRDASPAAMRALEAAGWSATDIVTLSQLVAFLTFQLRAASGLRALGASLGSPA